MLNKRPAFIAAAVMASLLLYRCAEEPQTSITQELKFEFAANDPDAFMNATSVIMSFKNHATGEAFERRVGVAPGENNVLTERFSLPGGVYTIERLAFTGASGEEFYSTSAGDFDDSPIAVGQDAGALQVVPLQITADSRARARHNSLTAFDIDGRHYQIYYNRAGNIDSIVATEGAHVRYVYRVTYTDGRIDSVETVNNGVVESIHDDFQYDDRGRILSYNYYFRLEGTPPDLAFPTAISYDHKGRIVSVNGNSFTYDNRDNVVSGFGATYTHDRGLNPLHAVPDLFPVMVEESFILEYTLSEHNAASKTTNGNTVVFNNVYDGRKRLIATDNMRFYYRR